MNCSRYANKPVDIYNFYVKTYGNPHDIQLATFSAIVKDFNKEVMRRILLQTLVFKLPSKLGTFSIGKLKHDVIIDENDNIKRFIWYPPDWKSTKELWARDPQAKKEKRIIRYMNDHSDGYTFTLFWDRSSCRVMNFKWYKAKLLKANKELLGSEVLAGNKSFNLINLKAP